MRHILVASLGGAPQVITEALWALMHPKKLIDPAHRGRQPVVPQIIHVLATSLAWPYASVAERDNAIREKIRTLYNQYTLEQPNIVIEQLMDGDVAVPDVRTQRQNIAYANAVTGIVGRLAADQGTAIHMLLAGGRKSMSSYDQSAMMFFGRVQDELVHALVEPDALERCRDFWWPDQDLDKIVKAKEGDAFATDSEAARVDLVNVPFVRLGVRLPEGIPGEAIDHERIVEFVQFEQMRQPVEINLADNSVTAGSQKVLLSPTNFIILATLAIIRKGEWHGAGPVEEGIGLNAAGWVLLDDLRYGLPERKPALSLASALRDRVLDRVQDHRTARERTVGRQEVRDDWVARAANTPSGGTDETTVVRTRCGKELESAILNPFIAGRLAPASYGRGQSAAIGLALPADRIHLRGFAEFASWLKRD